MAKRMQRCFNCGEELGVFFATSDEILSCGEPECERYAREAHEEQRRDAHERLDQERGW